MRINCELSKLEAVFLDPVGLVPFSQKWIEYWDRQFYLYMTGQDLEAIQHSPIDAFRYVMNYAEGNPASLVGSIPNLFERWSRPAQSREPTEGRQG